MMISRFIFSLSQQPFSTPKRNAVICDIAKIKALIGS